MKSWGWPFVNGWKSLQQVLWRSAGRELYKYASITTSCREWQGLGVEKKADFHSTVEVIYRCCVGKERKHTLFHTDKVQIKRGCIALAQAVSSCDYSYLYVLCCSLALILLLGPPVRAQKGFFAPCYWFLTCSGAPAEDKVKMCVFLLMFAYQVPAPRILEFNSLPGLELGAILLCFFHLIQACGDYCNAGVFVVCFFPLPTSLGCDSLTSGSWFIFTNYLAILATVLLFVSLASSTPWLWVLAFLPLTSGWAVGVLCGTVCKTEVCLGGSLRKLLQRCFGLLAVCKCCLRQEVVLIPPVIRSGFAEDNKVHQAHPK